MHLLVGHWSGYTAQQLCEIFWLQDHREVTWMCQKQEMVNLWFLIQNGNWDIDADSISSVNQGAYWDTGATLGRGEAPGRVKTLALWTPSLWKASPCHKTLREQGGHHPHATAATCYRLQMCLGDFWQTKQVRAKHHTVSFSHPWDKPAQPPWTDWSPPAGGKKKTEQ
jgi:hypothetical protein